MVKGSGSPHVVMSHGERIPDFAFRNTCLPVIPPLLSLPACEGCACFALGPPATRRAWRKRRNQGRGAGHTHEGVRERAP